MDPSRTGLRVIVASPYGLSFLRSHRGVSMKILGIIINDKGRIYYHTIYKGEDDERWGDIRRLGQFDGLLTHL